jgi:hypothetical protein
MERRQFERIIIGFHADISHKGETYSGVVENLSESGVCVISYPTTLNLEALKGEILGLKLHTFSDEILTMKCKVSWTAKVRPHKLTSRIGLEIIDPPWEKSSFIL